MATLALDIAKCDNCDYADNLFVVATSPTYNGELACGKCCQTLSLIAFPLDRLEKTSKS